MTSNNLPEEFPKKEKSDIMKSIDIDQCNTNDEPLHINDLNSVYVFIISMILLFIILKI